MIKTLSNFVLGAALIAGSLAAQQRTEYVPISNTGPAWVGIDAAVYGSNFSGFSVVGFVARSAGNDLGVGTIDSVNLGDSTPLSYVYGGVVTFTVSPDVPWYWWCAGLMSCTFKGYV